MEQRIAVTRSSVGKVADRIALWFISNSFVLIIALTMGIKARQRMSHNNGIAARGKFTADPDPLIPKHPFFAKGNVYPCRVRHGSATFYDDAMQCIRSCSIKMSDDNWKSPFDLELNTGKISLFWNVASFVQLAKLRQQQWGVEYQNYYKEYPKGKEAAIDNLRRNPTSFAHLIYHSQTPLLWVSEDGVKGYAKYRVRPFEDIPETGIISGRDVLEPQNQRVIPGETRTRNYLKEEYADRVRETKSVKYRLQVQTRNAEPNEDPAIFNSAIHWDENVFPFRDLGVIEIHETLNWDDSNMTTFSFGNLPKGLGIIPAKSIYDFNSLNYMRRKADTAKHARRWAYKIFGMPEEIPDSDNRNSSTIV